MNLSTLRMTVVSALLSFAASAGAYELTEATTCYLIHSSGSHIAKSADSKAVLEAADAENPAQLTITPLGNGLYSITAADGTFLSKSGSWNTSFVESGDSNDAKFRLEDTSGFFIKVRCQGNGKYLGCDSSKPGASVFSDKSGDNVNHHWYISDTPDAKAPDGEARYVINPSVQRQTIEGWGVSLCWWANVAGKWSDDKIDQLVDWLVSPEGLNFNIFRYNIGGGDDPDNANCTPHHMGKGKGLRAEMEGFKDSSDGPYIWTRDEAQRKIMLKIKEKRPDAIFEAFSNSCPWYMTYSGCCSGNTNSSKDNLKPEYYEEFAHYLVDVCKHYKDEYGIEFRTLDPFNEPMTSYWGCNGGQEGCHFDVSSQIAFLKVLSPILKESGLATVISASDETSVGQSVTDFKEYRKAGVLELVGQWNTHTYTVSDKARTQISDLCRQEGMRLWQSETGSGGSGIDGNLGMAQKLVNDVRHIQPSAWIDWQYMEEGNDQWCLVKGDFSQQTYERVKNYYIRSHFSRFIPAGYRMLTCFNSQTLVAESPENDRIVIVTINRTGTNMKHYADLSMFTSVSNAKGYVTDETLSLEDLTVAEGGKLLEFTLPPMSIATVTVDVAHGALADNTPAEGADYIIFPRLGSEVALAADGEAVRVKAVDYSPSQLWRLSASGNGFTFTNASGDIITQDGDNYALAVSKTAGDNQSFQVESIDGTFYRIVNNAGKGFDLEGEKSADGTGVGLWDYDETSVPTHRQWGFARVDYNPSAIETVGADNIGIRAIDGGVAVSGEGMLSVSNLSGVCLYSGLTHNGSLSLPLAPGIYVVALRSGASTSVRKLLVR